MIPVPEVAPAERVLPAMSDSIVKSLEAGEVMVMVDEVPEVLKLLQLHERIKCGVVTDMLLVLATVSFR